MRTPTKIQWIEMKQSYRVVAHDKKVLLSGASKLEAALDYAASQDGDPDVEQAVEFGAFGKYPEHAWISVFKLEALLSTPS